MILAINIRPLKGQISLKVWSSLNDLAMGIPNIPRRNDVPALEKMKMTML